MDRTEAQASLHKEAARLAQIHLRELLADRARDDLVFVLDDLSLDFSREKLDTAVLRNLIDLAATSDVEGWRDRLFAGHHVNQSEDRAALHMALRGGADAPADSEVDGVLDSFLSYAEQVRADSITDVINIGIGGSDLGPAMAAQALAPDCDGPRLHFVSNVDGAHFADTVRDLDPTTTLVIIVSKTFTTQETMANATLAQRWLGMAASANMAAVSTNLEASAALGIPESRVFGFWDWVGGRYSIWSAVGLSLAIGIGADRFRGFLDGAAAMDRHFRTAPLAGNLPVLLGLVGIWRRNFLGLNSVATVPYDQRLACFPAYLQQLEMESNGKSRGRDGLVVEHATSPVIWGEAGSNAQHSFFQMLHQGSDIVPVDFILAARSRGSDAASHRLLIANCLAQGEALALGRDPRESLNEPHRAFDGDRPSTLILHQELTPYALGRLIALYEHKVFVQAVIWGINPFDQWGVELGKQMAASLVPVIEGKAEPAVSLTGRVERLRALQSD